jgi:predicted GNAT family acetyltransferase
MTRDTGTATAPQTRRDAVLRFLAEQEAANSIQLSSLLRHPTLPPEPELFVAETGGEVAAVAAWTPPYKLVLAANTAPGAISGLVDAVLVSGAQIPGVLGEPSLANAFAAAWSARTGCTVRLEMEQRMLAATRIVPPSGVSGSARVVTSADRDQVIAWFAEFAQEIWQTAPDQAQVAGERMLDQMGTGRGGMFWIDAAGAPVSIAYYKAPTVTGIRIGPVYTPPQHRRRGYAAAVTAATSQYLLDSGYQFVCLYTDADNPTSNHVYESIGYIHVIDSVILAFDQDGPESASIR